MISSLKNKIGSLAQYLNDLIRPSSRTLLRRPAACYVFETVTR